jgi:uncharacterized protein YabE (DUF348 family)/3D (Asp-Asp-Asp) domain-containing protein
MRSKPSRSARSSRTQNTIVAFVAALIVVLSFTGFVWAQKRVSVVIDGVSQHVDTQAKSVDGVLRQLDVQYADGDLVYPSPDTGISSGTTIVVRHAIPVSLDLGGTKLSLKVIGKTVADALVAAGMDPAENPEVSPSLTTLLTPDMVISAPGSFVRVTEETSALAFETQNVTDSTLPLGSSRVVTEGQEGIAVSIYRTIVTDWVEGAKVLVSTSVVTPAVARVVAVGSARSTKIPISVRTVLAAPETYARAFSVVSTAYSPQEPELDRWTANGSVATYGVIAVDPRVIPLGTRVYVQGYGYAVAADTGGAIKGNRIDVCFDTIAECDTWGRRTVTIYILN